MLQRSFDGAERNPLVDALALKMDGKPNAVRDAFATFSRDSDENPPSAVRLFGGGSADEAFNYSFGVNLTEQEYHDGLDAAASKQPYVAPAENAAGDGAVPEISTWDQGAGGEQPAGADADGSEPGDAGERAATSGELEPGEGASASHGQPEGVQGWFRIRGDGTYEIAKTSLGDLSTFVHEPAHAYLEQFRELTQREAASPELKDDFAKIAEWLGTSPEVAYRDGFTVAQHEKWAEANTKYLREGKAPDSYLAQIFRHFSQWLSSVYKRTSRLGVEISPEIRGVMDRLYKSEQATRAAEAELPEPLFKSPEEAGWSEEEYKRYAERQGLNVSDAKARLIKEMHEAWVRERTQQWRQEKAATREAVTTEVDARPEYTAIRSLRRGTLDDGTEMTLNREALVSQFGEERVKALQQLHRGLYRQEGGTDAETAAEVLGFGSGEEMMRALERTPRRQAAIDAAVQARMTAEHGDVRYDGTAEDRARLNMEGDERARQTHSELQALRRQVARERKKAADTREALRAITTQPLEDYQRAARAMVEQKALADLTPMRYLIASRKFSREAFDAVRRGDAVTAAEAKNKELLNHFLYRAAMDAAEYGKKFERWVERVNKMPAQQRLGLAQENSGIDYRDQFNFLMARYGASKWPLTPPERSLRDWADEVYGNGNEVPIDPAVLNEGKAKNYKNVPLSELRNLHDALAVIHHLAGMEFKMFVQGKQVKFAEAKQAMIAAGEKNLRQNPEMTFEENRSFLDRKLDVFRSTDALLVRMERLVEWLDGGKTGPWHDNLWNLAADAQGDEYTMQHEVTRTVTESLENMNPELRRKLATEKVTVEGVGEALTRKRMLAMALNMGNEGNLDRMQKTFIDKGWDPAAIGKIAGLLTREEWQFVQGAWDSLKPLGQRMNEQEQRLSGLPPKMVEVLPLRVTPVDGDSEIELAGGYYPIAYDPKFTDKGRQQNEKEAAQNAMQSGYVRATTARGYTKDRTGYGGPLLFDYERVLTSHVAQVAKDLSHREFMLAAQRLLLDLNVQKMLRERLGPQYEAQMMPWLRTIINDRNGSIGQGLSPVSDGLQKLRGNLVTATIGLKVTTAILQIFHASKMLLYAKPGSIAQALGDMLARPMELTRENQELSPNEMRFRGENLDRDVRAALRDQSHAGTMKKAYVEAARWTLATMDHLMSHTLWRAAYRDGLEKFAELSEREAQRQAVLHADSAVRLGLGTNAPKDLPAIMRNNDFTKLITVLYGFHNGVYNQMRDNAHQFRYGGGVAKLTYSTILTALAPALLGALATGDKPKDGENWGLWAAKKALLFSADTVPLLGSVAHGMVEGRDMQLTPIENVLAKGVKALYHAAKPGDGDRDWLGIGLDAAESAGGILGVPGTGQVVKTARYLRRASAGKVQNPSVWGAVLGR